MAFSRAVIGVQVHPPDAAGNLIGRSNEGGTFTVRSERLFLASALTTDGRRFELHVGDLVRNLRYPIEANLPGNYRAILAPRGRFIFGRNCFPRNCNANIIGGDKACLARRRRPREPPPVARRASGRRAGDQVHPHAQLGRCG